MLHARVIQLSSSTGKQSLQFEHEILVESVNRPSKSGKSVRTNTSEDIKLSKLSPSRDSAEKLRDVDIKDFQTGTRDFQQRKFGKKDAHSERKSMKRKTRSDENQSNFGTTDFMAEDIFSHRHKVKSADKFKEELLGMIQKGKRTPEVMAKQMKHEPNEKSSENISPEFRKFTLKPLRTSSETKSVEWSKNKKRKATLNEIYERKNSSIQEKKDRLKARETNLKKTSIFDTIHPKNSLSNLNINPEFREGLEGAKKVFEYKSKDDLSASDAKAALGYFDVLYDKTGPHSAGTSNETDNQLEHVNETVSADVTEMDNKDNASEGEYQKIHVSDAEWEVLKKIRFAVNFVIEKLCWNYVVLSLVF